MIVYVVTNVEAGWDCVCGVFSSAEELADYFTSLEIDYWEEDPITEEEVKKVKDFTGMSIESIEKFLDEASTPYIIHVSELR